MNSVISLPVISLYILLTASLVPLGATLCYTTGKSLNRARAGYHVGRACKGYDGNAGAFHGLFAAHQNAVENLK